MVHRISSLEPNMAARYSQSGRCNAHGGQKYLPLSNIITLIVLNRMDEIKY